MTTSGPCTLGLCTTTRQPQSINKLRRAGSTNSNICIYLEVVLHAARECCLIIRRNKLKLFPYLLIHIHACVIEAEAQI